MAPLVGIIGSSCRFPGEANTPSELWELLESPRDVLKEFPKERLQLQNFYHPNGEHHGSTNVQNKAYLLSEEIKHFDAPFFHVSPREAAAMDPQHRIMLETVYEALEAAGLPLDRIRGSLTSVWAGLMNGDFADIQARDLDTLPVHHATGTHRSILSNRVSYFFDARGSSMTIDTACSSSLVALHQAVQSLRTGESDMAIVGGANLILDPTMYVAESKLHMLSPDSRSRMWDADANGYARGEGFAAVVLQRVEDAIQHRNHIECVIRGSAVNSDGRGQGSLTVPSAAAQTELIRRAYNDAGLDARLDRCHFFEAHGTGTQAGDPIEARAIRDAFFSDDGCTPDYDTNQPRSMLPEKLLVGSIKTLIGHLEGCAGLAGILKASLAIQHGLIPPNLLFSRLSPSVAPFYDNLEIVTGQSRPWPVALEPGSPRRVSVNSFGFGGTNAHVILESYVERQGEQNSDIARDSDQRIVVPLLFSANSWESLSRSVEAHAQSIADHNKTPCISDIAWTLSSRRTHFPTARTSFAATTREQLVARMNAFAQNPGRVIETDAVDARRAAGEAIDILGIFTGQGAQWASMGRDLFLHCQLFRDSIKSCETALLTLESSDAPEWSLVDELLAENEISRVAEAAISQPLCTAIQIALVDLLHACGIRFRAVIGHSSGEIAAAYAAGILPRASDAIRIAYYRGLHIARDSGLGRPGSGAMLAVGVPYETATEMCAREDYAGRTVVAAVNSPNSVTISGDVDAIDLMKSTLDAEGTFARKLKVDRAYHSPHMEPCAPAYCSSLRACAIQVENPSNDCTWLSSVRGDIDSVLTEDNDGCDLQTLQDQYWVDNLTSPVLFGPALECALWRAGPFDAVIEVGPHPALQGPVTQLLKASLGNTLPYFGVIRRNTNDVEAFSGALGSLWEKFGTAAGIDFDAYRKACMASGPDVSATTQPRLVKGLPSYSWDHDKLYWREPKVSRLNRLADRPSQNLLGRRAPDDNSHLLRWRNVLRINDIKWVTGHKFQDQVVLPGVSYISAMVELARQLVDVSLIDIITLRDVVLHKAIPLQEDRDVDFYTSCHIIHKAPELLIAQVTFSAGATDSDASADTTCSVQIEIQTGSEGVANAKLAVLNPIDPPTDPGPIDVESFYARLKDLGLAFGGPFKAIKSAQRKLNHAEANCSWNLDDDFAGTGREYVLHPAVLDASLHSLLAAFASPATDRLWAPALPVSIQEVSIITQHIPGSLASVSGPHLAAAAIARVSNSSQQTMQGDIQVTFAGFDSVAVQMKGVQLQMMASLPSYQHMFSHVKWDTDISTGLDKVTLAKALTDTTVKRNGELIEAMGRTALFYYRTLLESLTPSDLAAVSWHHDMFIKSAQHWVGEVRASRHPTVENDWLRDTQEDISHLHEEFRDCIDIELMNAIGGDLMAIIQGVKQPLEVMMENEMLTRFYINGHGLDLMNDHIARAVSQVTHRYPGAQILELGAGTAGTTRKVMRAIKDSFAHYTFTDISAGFFERAAHKFPDHVRRREMSFSVLDIEQDVMQQGFEEAAYDIVVAANVIHATKDLERSMRNVRRLLKPGGFLIMMEITGDLLRLGFILGILPGWWLGAQTGDEGRRWAPGISLPQWDDLLKRTGFSGLDEAVSDNPAIEKHYLSTLFTQAVDERVDFLRSPLVLLPKMPALPVVSKLFIIGGTTDPVARLAHRLKRVLTPWDSFEVIHLSKLDHVVVNPQDHVSIISLVELDHNDFLNTLNSERLRSLKTALQSSKTVLWLTSGCSGKNPWANMFKGVARAVRAEQPQIVLQTMDVGSDAGGLDTLLIAEAFARLEFISHPIFKNDESPPLLWSTETELALQDGLLLIPRLVSNSAQNDRYNARRQIIKKELSSIEAEDWQLELTTTSNGILSLTGLQGRVARQLLKGSAGLQQDERISFKVMYSVALAEPKHRQWLCFGSLDGQDRVSTKYAFAVTDSNKSVIHVAAQQLLLWDHLDLLDQSIRSKASEILQAMAGQLIVRSILSRTPPRGSVLIIEPTTAHMHAIAACRLWKKRETFFASRSKTTAISRELIWIDPHFIESRGQSMFSVSVNAVIELGSSTTTQGHPPRQHSGLSPDAVSIRFEPAFIETNLEALRQAFHDAYAQVTRPKSDGALNGPVDVVPISQIMTHPTSLAAASYPYVIDWQESHSTENAPATAPFVVQPLNPNGLFSACKTHFMVGLNGDLGVSVCNFMAENGARHIAIGSRSGEVSPNWRRKMTQKGVNVRVYKMDVAVKEEILTTLESMRRDDMPPVCGVANGALVLHDNLFINTDAETFNAGLRPKVTGSQALNEVFDAHLPLDYFVLFSSLATIAGNSGQASYHAANMFMTGLVDNRRMRGLSASVMHVGVVADAGYVTRQGPKLLEHLRRQYFMSTSEADVHQQFSEAVLASPADSGLVPDVCMGLIPFSESSVTSSTTRPSWANDPMLSHFVVSRDGASGEAAESQPSNNAYHGLPLKQVMTEAASAQDAESIIQQAFSTKLESLMQLDPGSVNIKATLLDHGFDSLLAVETRTWFLSELSVDVPVLRFLSSETIEEICTDSTTQFLAACTSETASDQAGQSLHSDDSAEVSTQASTSRTPVSGDSSFCKDALPGFDRVFSFTHSQRRLWKLGQQTGDPTANNIAVSYTIKGRLDVEQLRSALLHIVSHHPALRMCFWADSDTEELKQGLLPRPTTGAARTTPLFKHIVASDTSATSELVRSEFQALKKQQWSLEEGESLGATLVSDEDGRSHMVIFGYSMLVMDGLSWHIFLTDLDRAYRMQSLSPISVTTSHMDAKEQDFDPADIMFWKDLYTPPPVPLPLFPFALASARSQTPQHDLHRVTRTLDSALVSKIKATSGRLRTTPSQFYLATLQALVVALLPDLPELCIGIHDANRPSDGSLSEVIGYFVNVLPLRLTLPNNTKHDNTTFSTMARSTAAHVLEARHHSHIPLQVIAEHVGATNVSLFNVAFNYRVGAMAEVPLGDSSRMSVAEISDVQNSLQDLTLGLYEDAASSFSVHITCKRYLYTSESAAALIDAYVALLRAFAVDEDANITDVILPSIESLRTR